MSDSEASSPGPGATSSSPTALPERFGSGLWTLALSAGFVAGMAAWGLGEATLIPEAGFQSKNEKRFVSQTVAGFRNGSICFGALGAAMGLGLGMTGGLARRSTVRAVIAGTTGLTLGGAAGVALTQLMLPVYYEHSRSSDITYSLIVHGGIWAGVAATAGLAFAIGWVGWRGVLRGVLGAVAGALVATVVHEIAGGILFPLASTDRPISQTWETRLMARLLVSMLAAAGVVLCSEPAPEVAGGSPARQQEE